jgi:hypothetical protein
MIEKVYNDCQNLTILEMRMYLRAEISKFCLQDYKNMSLENKVFLYNLNSFLYFCNKFESTEDILKAMANHCNTKEFINRYK